MIEACVTNLGKYNEGDLVYEQVTLPTTPEIMENALKNIGIRWEYEEYFLSDSWCDEISRISGFIGEYSNLEELNYLATKLDELDSHELEVFEACIGDHVSSIGDAINLTENLDCFILHSDIESQYDLGYYYVNESEIYDLDSMGTLGNYIDYDAFGRDILLDGNGVITDYGYLEEVDSMTEIYCDINDIPDEYRLFGSGEEEEHENDLENTELDTEINFNQMDGVRNHLKSEEEKPSILESLKEGKAAVKEANQKEEHTQKKPSKDCDSR